MPKLTGPCFSLSASKTLKKLLTFQRKKGQNLSVKYHQPGSREPFNLNFAQACQRADIGFLVVAWQDLSAEEKEGWDDDAKVAQYIGTGYHYFIHKHGGQPMSFFRRIKIWDGVTEWLIDKLRGGVTIDFDHHKVHEGDLFTAGDWQDGIADEATQDYLIRTPDSDQRCHIKILVAAALAGKLELFESPDITDDGTVVPSLNNNRNSSNIAGCLIFKGPTVGGGGTGTLLEPSQMPAGSKSKLGGEARTGAEWILGKNKEYLVRFTSQTANNIISIIIQFYEADAIL